MKQVKYKQGLCKAIIYKGDNDQDHEVHELTYEAEDHGDGYEVHCERPDVPGASDLLQDVTAALEADGLQNIYNITWL
jgi:hypothetical protein